MARLLMIAAVALAAIGALAGGAVRDADARAADDACVTIPSRGAPLWVDYGEGSVPAAVRDVLARPGVTLAASGTALPARYRTKGARTTYWVLKLPTLVGSPASPARPDAVIAAADRVYDRAVASTLCARPIVTLNELTAPAAPLPWSDGVRAYRANVLALVQRLAERGAVPVLLVHGAPVLSGEAAAWWRAVGAAGHVAYESYYKAPSIARLGRIVGPRRVRLGMRSIVRSLAAAGVPRSRIGLVLGFQTTPGTAGREGLQPTASWLRYVKWNALAAQQVAADEGVTSIWSWGWGNLGPRAADPDKPAAACVYLWARDATLCDGPRAAGAGFDRSRVEGAIVMANAVQCVSVVGKLARATVTANATALGSVDDALSATFARQVLRRAVPVASDEVIAAEQALLTSSFGGARSAYLAALAAARLTPATARGVVEDGIRRQRVAALAASAGRTPLDWIADRVSAALATATCRGDRLPGAGDFPTSDVRESAGAAVGRPLPVLLGDVTPPATPTAVGVRVLGPTAVELTWVAAAEPDLVGFEVLRLDPVGGLTSLTRQPWPRPRVVVRGVRGGDVLVVRAVDLAGSTSAPTAPLVVPAAG